ncbi:MAG: DUF488 family protein [Aestuariivirga sp.]
MKAATAAIQICRAYDAAHASGARLLVDRLWPRGVSKATLRLDDWIKEVAPSNDLRHWFHVDPVRGGEFRVRYVSELNHNSEPVAHCLVWCAKGPVTLLFAAHDSEHNNAVVLRDYLIACQIKEHRKDGN